MDHTSRFQRNRSEAALVRRAKEGDRIAFDWLVRDYRPLLLGIAFMRTGNADEANDLVQEALQSGWQKLPGLNNPAAFGPWLKTITANACNSWRRSATPMFLHDQTELVDLADRGLTPLDALLARETRLELDEALLAVPAINRLALMLHSMEGASYEEIARLTGVPLSTVDGRIRRAKTQLKRLLDRNNSDTAGTQPLPTDLRREREAVKRTLRPGRRKMTTVAQQEDHSTHAFALLSFTDQFATLIESGVSLSRSLEVLADIAAPPYSDAAAKCKEWIDLDALSARSLTIYPEMYIEWLNNPDMYPRLIEHLTRAVEEKCSLFPKRSVGLGQVLGTLPDLFSPFFNTAVYWGDSRGTLDETLRELTNLMEKEWSLAGQRPPGEDGVFMFLPKSRPISDDWKGLTPYQQMVSLTLLFRGFGVLLKCGVPILSAMETSARMLPSAQAEAWLSAREDIKRGDRILTGLNQMEIFPDYALQLIGIGEEMGSLDAMLFRAADLFEHDFERRRAWESRQ